MNCKHWCFTLNNYNESEITKLTSLASSTKYLIFGKEVGENGTPHLQGYVVFNSKKRLRQLKALVSERAHFEKKRGSPKQAADYCKKDGDYQEYGQLPAGAGARSDLDELYRRITEGQSRDEIAESFPGHYIRYGRRIDSLINRQVDKPRDYSTDKVVVVIHGTTGTGKTRFVYDKYGGELYSHGGSSKWFDGYIGQRVALFDDYDGSVFKLRYLLNILDRYPMKVEVKGDTREWSPDIIFITSNKAPEDWYANAYPEHVNAMMRRIAFVHDTANEWEELEIFLNKLTTEHC